MMLRDVSYGALTQLYAGTISDGASLNGKVCSNRIWGMAQHSSLASHSTSFHGRASASLAQTLKIHGWEKNCGPG